jgi:hypothetical protein
MVRKIFKSGWTYLIIAFIVAIWTLFAEAYNVWGEYIFSFLSPEGAKIANLAVFFILAIIAMVIPNLKLYRTENSRPNIIPHDQPFKLEKPFHLIVNNKPTDTIIKRYYFMLCNRKGKSKYNIVDTDIVHALVDFYDDKEKRLDSISHEQPFWLGSLPPWERSSSHNTYIKASGKPEGICLVVRKSGDDKLYAFSDMSYNANFRTIAPFTKELELPKAKIIIRIQLLATNLDIDPFWILLTNHGADKEPEFSLIEVK